MSCFSGLASFIVEDLDYPDNLAVGQVVNWLALSVGNLNTILGTSYTVNESGCPVPDMGLAESGILLQMYKIRFYNQQMKYNLGASAYDWSELREGDSVIRRVSKNEIAKNYLSLARDSQSSLKDMIKYYRTNKATARSISSYNTPFRMFYRLQDGYVHNNACGGC